MLSRIMGRTNFDFEESGTLSDFPKQTEVVVIGAGIAGTMTAYQLAKRGVPTVLCEKGRVTCRRTVLAQLGLGAQTGPRLP